MENVDQLFNASGYHHSYPHSQQPLYQFFPSQQQQQHALSRQPSPHPSPASTSIPASPHGLYVQQQQHQSAQESSTQEQREPDNAVDQIQDDAPIDEEPLYVNAKQYYRILKRRVARARLEEVHRLSRQRKPYLHESRHKHAMRRPRGPGGRFLTSEEIAAQKATQSMDAGPSASTSQDGDDDDDVDHGDIVPDGDTDMALASPTDDRSKSIVSASPRLADPPAQRSNTTSQPSLQPRPQLQIPTQSTQQHLLPSQSMFPPQSQPQSPFDHPMSISHSELLTAYHAASHPPTPAPVSPHASIPDLMQHTQDRLQHDHGHSHHGHTHDHQRHISSSIAHNGSSPAVPPTPPAAAPSLALRSSYAQMQMHHVPHPHAHARHHHSYLNRAEQLYVSGGQGNMSVRYEDSEQAPTH